MFRAFAARHGLSIEKVENAPVELMMTVPKQPGLGFEMTLACQNGDELNIGVEPFWSTFFPFEQVRGTVERALDGLVSGDCTILLISQRGRPVRGLLQMRDGPSWRTIATHIVAFKIPFVTTSETRLSNLVVS